jgi:hypothetical protein
MNYKVAFPVLALSIYVILFFMVRSFHNGPGYGVRCKLLSSDRYSHRAFMVMYRPMIWLDNKLTGVSWMQSPEETYKIFNSAH